MARRSASRRSWTTSGCRSASAWRASAWSASWTGRHGVRCSRVRCSRLLCRVLWRKGRERAHVNLETRWLPKSPLWLFVCVLCFVDQTWTINKRGVFYIISCSAKDPVIKISDLLNTKHRALNLRSGLPTEFCIIGGGIGRIFNLLLRYSNFAPRLVRTIE